MAELSGEQKLRIVLESIIRKIPKEEQCSKYKISESQFQSWHDQLVNNGGKIFEEDFSYSSRSSRKSRKLGFFTKLVLVSSLLLNLGVLVVFSVIKYKEATEPPMAEPQEMKLSDLDSPVNSPVDDLLLSDSKAQDLDLSEDIAGSEKSTGSKSQFDSPELQNLLANPLNLPQAEILAPATPPDLASEVTFLNQVYEGRHVVYVLDAGLYMLKGEGASESFEAMKDALLSSIVELSPNSFFNLVLFWNLREASALGKTILRANQENKKFAIDWIAGLGSDPEKLKDRRNQFYPKELLYAKPLAGVVGPWYGLTTAISYDPDLVFVFSGNLPSFSMDEVPMSHFQELDIRNLGMSSSGNNPVNGQMDLNSESLLRETAKRWYLSTLPAETIPDGSLDSASVAMRKLGFSENNETQFQSMKPSIPWEKAFDRFLTGLEVSFDKIPPTHFHLCLPKYQTWPTALSDTVREFAESSQGSFVLNPKFP